MTPHPAVEWWHLQYKSLAQDKSSNRNLRKHRKYKNQPNYVGFARRFQYLKTINARMSQKKILLHNKYFKAITWGSHESNWRIHLQELLRQEQQRVKEKNECLKMGHEEIANSKVERKIGTVLMFFMCGFIFLDNFLTLTSSFLWNNSD